MKTFDDYMRTLPRAGASPSGHPLPRPLEQASPQASAPDPPAFDVDRSVRALLARARSPRIRWPRLRSWQAAVAGGAVVLGFLAQFAFDLAALGHDAQVGQRLTAVEARLASTQSRVEQRLGMQDARIAESEKVLSQALLPPPALARADHLAAAGRLRDAEAAWAGFLAESPGSPLTAAVLGRSALAALALGDCQLALSRRAELKTLEPRHPVLLQRQAWAGCPAAPGR